MISFMKKEKIDVYTPSGFTEMCEDGFVIYRCITYVLVYTLTLSEDNSFYNFPKTFYITVTRV